MIPICVLDVDRQTLPRLCFWISLPSLSILASGDIIVSITTYR